MKKKFKPKSGNAWRLMSNKRNMLKGQLLCIQVNLNNAIDTPDILDTTDKMRAKTALKYINSIIQDWDKHYIKKLRQRKDGE